MESTTLHISKYTYGEIICVRFKNDIKEKSFCGDKGSFLKWIEDKVV